MVRAAAEGTVLLDARLDRTGIVPKIKQKLCEARPGHYAVDLILGHMLLEHDYEVQGDTLFLGRFFVPPLFHLIRPTSGHTCDCTLQIEKFSQSKVGEFLSCICIGVLKFKVPP